MKSSRVVLKAAVTLALMGWLVQNADLAHAGARLRDALIFPMVGAVAALLMQPVLAAARWTQIMADVCPWRWGTAARIVYIGQFCNLMLPATVGGDAVRAWYARRAGMPLGRALISVALDRLFGLKALVLIAAMSIPWIDERMSGQGASRTLVGGIVLFVIGLLLIATLDRLLGRNVRSKALRFLAELALEFRRTLAGAKRAAWLVVLSLMIHALTIGSVYLLALALTMKVELLDIALIVPPVMVLSMVPVSLGGWGVREGSMVIALAQTGLPVADGAVLSIAFGLAVTASALPGGFFWLMQRERKNIEREAALLDGPVDEPRDERR